MRRNLPILSSILHQRTQHARRLFISFFSRHHQMLSIISSLHCSIVLQTHEKVSTHKLEHTKEGTDNVTSTNKTRKKKRNTQTHPHTFSCFECGACLISFDDGMFNVQWPITRGGQDCCFLLIFSLSFYLFSLFLLPTWTKYDAAFCSLDSTRHQQPTLLRDCSCASPCRTREQFPKHRERQRARKAEIHRQGEVPPCFVWTNRALQEKLSEAVWVLSLSCLSCPVCLV